MKIAIVCFNLKWQAGGTRLIFSLAQGLKKNGHVVSIYAPDFNEDAYPEMQKGLDIRIVPPPAPLEWTKNPVGLISKVMFKLRQRKLQALTAEAVARAMEPDFDVVNVHDFAYKTGYFYKKINPRVKVVWNENDPPFSYLPKSDFFYDLASRAYNAFVGLAERKYLRVVDRAVVLDFYNRDWCAARGIPSRVVRSGVDFKNFYIPVRRREKGKKSVLVLGIGALNKYRRFEDIVRAIKILRDNGYDARALVICKNIWGEESYKEKLLALRAEEGLGEYVDFRFQGVSNEELKNAYRASDIFALPIYLPPPRNGYGWGLANFEAMAAGLPLIICRTSTATEVLADGVNAMFVDPMSPAQIAQKIEALLKDPMLYAKIATNGQSFVRDNISWDRYAAEMLEIFSS